MTARWALLTNHALVLIHITEHRRSTLREIAGSVGITERAALSILRALEEDGIISRKKDGRRNVYSVDLEALMATRHGPYTIEELARALFMLAGRTPSPDLPGSEHSLSNVAETEAARSL